MSSKLYNKNTLTETGNRFKSSLSCLSINSQYGLPTESDFLVVPISFRLDKVLFNCFNEGLSLDKSNTDTSFTLSPELTEIGLEVLEHMKLSSLNFSDLPVEKQAIVNEITALFLNSSPLEVDSILEGLLLTQVTFKIKGDIHFRSSYIPLLKGTRFNNFSILTDKKLFRIVL